jgi:dTDP-4-dehydrorhamnose 3,5-epimerase
MSLARPPSGLPGVRYGAVVRHVDDRGSFRELWRTGDGPSFVQVNLSTSAAGVLRGLHLHQHQLDHWVVASGRVFLALVDVRPLLDGSESAPTVETRELDADDWVVIPEGVAHGFLALEPLQLLYLVTNLYDGSDELGFAWDDPAVGVPWPDQPPARSRADAGSEAHGGPLRPIVSERDATNPPLADLVARIRAQEA